MNNFVEFFGRALRITPNKNEDEEDSGKSTVVQPTFSEVVRGIVFV